MGLTGTQINDLLLMIAGICTFLSTIVTSILILGHFVNYNKPSHQKYIVRILLMAPIYAIDSWFSLYFHRDRWALFIDIFRDCYEAYVLYSFFKLLVCFLGGEEAINALAVRKTEIYHPFPFNCIQVASHKLYIKCLRAMVQYALVKPTMAIVAMAAYIGGRYVEGNFSPAYAFLYVTIINNVSVIIALYYLVLFYNTFSLELQPYRPILKFMVIKGVIFFTFWQAMAIALAIQIGYIRSYDSYYTAHRIAYIVNDFLVCVEMLVAALAHIVAFSYEDYKLSSFSESLVENRNRSCFQRFLMFRSNLRRYQPNIKDGVKDVNNNNDVVLDTIKSVKKQKHSVDYQNFINLTIVNEKEDDYFQLKRNGIPNSTSDNDFTNISLDSNIHNNNQDRLGNRQILRDEEEFMTSNNNGNRKELGGVILI